MNEHLPGGENCRSPLFPGAQSVIRYATAHGNWLPTEPTGSEHDNEGCTNNRHRPRRPVRGLSSETTGAADADSTRFGAGPDFCSGGSIYSGRSIGSGPGLDALSSGPAISA